MRRGTRGRISDYVQWREVRGLEVGSNEVGLVGG